MTPGRHQAAVAADRRFLTLDALRAVGALMVLLTHVGFQTGRYPRGWTGAMLAHLDLGVAAQALGCRQAGVERLAEERVGEPVLNAADLQLLLEHGGPHRLGEGGGDLLGRLSGQRLHGRERELPPDHRRGGQHRLAGRA